MRALSLLVALTLIGVAPGPAGAGFKLKFTHLADIDPVVTSDTEVPSPAPPAGPPVLVSFHSPGWPGDHDLSAGRGTIPALPTPDLSPLAGNPGPGVDPLSGGGSLAYGDLGAMGDGTGFGELGPRGRETVSNPEPTGLTLAALGIAGLVAYGWRGRRAPAG